MASIEKRTREGRTVWRAHYRTPGGRQRNKTFTRKLDAERLLATVENAKNTGSYVDPSLSRVTVGDWAHLPRFLVDDLSQHLANMEPDDLVFAGISRGSPLRVSTFRKAFKPAAQEIGMPDLYPHELRHTAASLAIASGADVKVVQQMLGHGSATMTLDTYGHLFENRLDEVAEAMDLARTSERQRTAPSVPAEPPVARVLPDGATR